MATILPHQNKLLPQWPYGLQINTLVSIYFTVIKAAILFILAECLGQLKWGWFTESRPLNHLATYDDATRGPWGSLSFLWKLRGRAVLPSIAAVTIILATILDPFGQQLIRFYSCRATAEPGSQAPTVARNRFVDGGHPGGGPDPDFASADFAWSISANMQAAMLGGIYQLRPDPITPNCPTGNCTFSAAYSSAGWCSKCEDITDMILVEDVPETNITIPFGDSTVEVLEPAHQQAVIRITDELNNFTLDLAAGLNGPPRLAFDVLGYEEDASGPKIRMLLGSDGPEMNFGKPFDYEPDSWVTKKYGAASCQLNPCVRKYSAEVVNGNMTETMLSESSEWGYSPLASYQKPCWSMLEVSCLNRTEKANLRSRKYIFNDTQHFIPFNFSGMTYPDQEFYNWQDTYFPEGAVYIREECVYQVCQQTLDSVQGYLGTWFTGWTGKDVWESSIFVKGLPHLQTIYKSGNVSFASVQDTFARIAHSMTLENRAADRRYAEYATGEAWAMGTCVEARWIWLVYPAILAVATFVFFLSAVIWARTGRGGELARQNYKTSVLPLMFHGVERVNEPGGGKKVGGVLERSDEIQEESKTLRVRLDRTGDGWRFREA